VLIQHTRLVLHRNPAAPVPQDAGTIAGLNVVRIINEPTAAAIAYGALSTQPRPAC
jgi:hypothetical protein